MAIVDNDYAAYVQTSAGEVPLKDLNAQEALEDIKVGYDGTIYDTPGNAIRKQVFDLRDALNELTYQDIVWTDGAYLSKDNAISENKIYSYSDYIRIPKGVSVSYRSYFSSLARTLVFDENKNIIDRISNTDPPENRQYNGNLDAADFDRYIRLSCVTANKEGAFVRLYSSISSIVSKFYYAIVGYGSRINGESESIFDCNNAKPNTVYTFTTSVDNAPAKRGTMLTLNTDHQAGGQAQIFISPPNGNLFIRIGWGRPLIWSEWFEAASIKDLAPFKAYSVAGYGKRINSTDILDTLDNALTNCVYCITGDYCKNMPEKTGGTMLAFYCNDTQEGGVAQFFVDAYGKLYVRIKWKTTEAVEWTEWHEISTSKDLDKSIQGIEESYYCDISMFERIGVVGDSFASGVIYTGIESEDENATHYNLSWGQNLARQSGIECINYSVGGINTKGYLVNQTYGLPKVLSDIANGNPCGLYLLCLGINDSNDQREPGGLSYLGTSADIDDADYNNNADTFWGNYGRIIAQIKNASPKSKLIMSTFCRKPTKATEEGYVPFNSAIQEIANYFEIPCIVLTDDSFFNSDFYLDGMVRSHPTAPLYSGYAKAINRLLSKCVMQNYDYFKDYTGLNGGK